MCNSFYPLGNYFLGIPDLRPRRLRLGLYERAWFRIFGVESEQDYEADIDARMNELSYYIALLKGEYSTEYGSDVEHEFLKEFNGIIGEGRVLSIGCGDGRELRLIGRKGLGIDLSPSNIVLSNLLGVKALPADILNLPFEDEAFDGVLAIQSLEYIPVKLIIKCYWRFIESSSPQE